METTTNIATQEVAQSNKYIVSDNTAMFIDLLRKQDALFRDISNAVEKFYGASNIDELMDKDFFPILFSLQDKIFEYIKFRYKSRFICQ